MVDRFPCQQGVFKLCYPSDGQAILAYQNTSEKLSIFVKCTGQEVLKLWCYALSDRFQRYVEILRKSDERVL